MTKNIACFIMLLCIHVCSRAQETFSTGFDMIWCGDAKIVFDRQCAEEQPGIQFLHVHENEKTAIEAATAMLKKFKHGCFVTWQANNDRYVSFNFGDIQFKFDPNRIYTPTGRAATLNSNGPYSREADSLVKRVADDFVKKYIDSQSLVIALHNNKDDNGKPIDSGLTVHSFKKGGPYAKDAKMVYVNKAKDKDDFFYTTEERIYNFLKMKGFNIILQDNDNVSDDGSLSVYAATKKIPYLNVEAQHGHLQQQLKMLDAVQEMINELYQ